MERELQEEVQKNLKELFEEESLEVGLYLARARRAREQGYPEVADLIEQIGRDEATHLSLVVEILYPQYIERDLRTNLRAMISGDGGAADRERRMAEIARRAGMEREALLFERLARDELEHVAKIEAVLRQLPASG